MEELKYDSTIEIRATTIQHDHQGNITGTDVDLTTRGLTSTGEKITVSSTTTPKMDGIDASQEQLVFAKGADGHTYGISTYSQNPDAVKIGPIDSAYEEVMPTQPAVIPDTQTIIDPELAAKVRSAALGTFASARYDGDPKANTADFDAVSKSAHEVLRAAGVDASFNANDQGKAR